MRTIASREENINRPDEVLRELMTGIIVVGVIGQLICLFIPTQVLFLSIGWWVGIAVAIFMAWHMYRNISNALDMAEGDAISSVRYSSMIRYGTALVLMMIVHYSGAASVVSYVIALFSLKIGAYIQPIMHSVMVWLNISTPYDSNSDMDDDVSPNER